MKQIETTISGLICIEPSIFGDDRGFFIGLHPKKISNKELEYLEKNLLKINIL